MTTSFVRLTTMAVATLAVLAILVLGTGGPIPSALADTVGNDRETSWTAMPAPDPSTSTAARLAGLMGGPHSSGGGVAAGVPRPGAEVLLESCSATCEKGSSSKTCPENYTCTCDCGADGYPTCSPCN